MRKLPPLNALKAFEAAARLGSMTAAGLELNVTHGAVSRQVALLEDWLGVAVFDRAHSRLLLTDDGRVFFGEVSAALDRVALAAMQISHNRDVSQLNVSAPPTFTLRWLIPRLSAYQRRHLGINVCLTTSLEPVNFSRESYHIAIRGSREPVEGVVSRPFMTEKIVPICSPAVRDKHPLAGIHDLARHTLISYSTEPYSWRDWFVAQRAKPVKPAGTLDFEQMYFALQAAQEGLGIALIPYFLVADDISAGRLCAPLGEVGGLTRRYWLNLSPAVQASAAQEGFCRWIEQEGAETMALCDRLMARTLDLNESS
jgi:LysR family glycine cleavage system transcriptional activator